jgi:hypothetical protein
MHGNASVVLGTLAFLGTGFALFLTAVAAIALSLSGRGVLARRIALLAGAGVAIYTIALAGVSLASRDQALPAGSEKYFCELDCHLAYSVTDLRTARTIGTGPASRTPDGVFYLITLRTRFDETTISPQRGDGELYPNPRGVWLVDPVGRRYPALTDTGAVPAAANSGTPSTPISTPLRPGESYLTTLVFDLPVGVRGPKLLLTENVWPTWFVIGHENSLLHRKTLLELPPSVTAAQ